MKLSCRLFYHSALYPIILLLINALSLVYGQGVVMHKDDPALPRQARYAADVAGYVLIHSDALKNKPIRPPVDSITLLPYWPQTREGLSQRGGIACQLDDDPDLEVVYVIGESIYAWNCDGSDVSGWPVPLQFGADGAPSFGDIDSDGIGEIVVGTRLSGTGNEGILVALERDGTPVNGFPVTLWGGAARTAVLCNLDADPALEIILAERSWPEGKVFVYQGDGSIMTGWPQHLDHVPGSGAAVGDITGDSVPEIVAESYLSIYAFDLQGNLLSGFPYTPGSNRVFSYSTPVLADLDDDGCREIIAGDHSNNSGYGMIHVIRNDGTAFPGWPKITSNWVYAPVAVADFDMDGDPEIASGDQMASTIPWCHIYVWEADGTYLSGWPSPYIWPVNCQIIVADLDGDRFPELVWDDNSEDGWYHAYNHDGTPLNGWPLAVQGSTFFMNPATGDFNADGTLDLTGGGIDAAHQTTSIHLWTTNIPYRPEKAFLPVLQYNVQHTGVFRFPEWYLAALFTADNFQPQVNQPVHFTDLSAGTVTGWSWHFEGGLPEYSMEQNPVVIYPEPGLFEVTLIVNNIMASDTLTRKKGIQVHPVTGINPLFDEEDDPARFYVRNRSLVVPSGSVNGRFVLTIYSMDSRALVRKELNAAQGSDIIIPLQGIGPQVCLICIARGICSRCRKLMMME